MKYPAFAWLLSLLGVAMVDGGLRADPAFATGAERLVAENFDRIAGLRVGLITNPTGTVGGEHLADRIHASPAVELAALFGPEHGIRGDLPAGRGVASSVDEPTGVPVHSLYGAHRRPTSEMLEGIDALLFDIQDIGARFYTYISTMGYAMQAAAENGVQFIVLDRPNPLGGHRVEGFRLEPGYESFVGLYPIPVRHGLTIGELALLIRGEAMLEGLQGLELSVVELEGWARPMQWPDLEREWQSPSPNIPDFETALIYPGACLLEGTTASEGRGTHEPFKKVGAPWVDPKRLADELNGQDLPGLTFEPVSFTPVRMKERALNPKFRGREVHGVRYRITDRQKVRPVEAGLHLLAAFLAQAPDKPAFFHEERIQRLAGTDRLPRMLLEGHEPRAIVESWAKGVAEFQERRSPYLLY